MDGQAQTVWKAERPLGLQYIAQGLGIEYGTIGAMRNRGNVPPEDGWINDKVPFWYESTVVLWARTPKGEKVGNVTGAGLVPAETEPTWEAVMAARRGR